MTIKDVEKQTGLTAKSIRLYEQKGLLTVERNRENDYRRYTADNVIRLKWIKLYRYLSFSVEEIKELLKMDSTAVIDRLTEKMQAFEQDKDDIDVKADILLQLTKGLKKGEYFVDDYIDTIEFWESDEMEELKQLRMDVSLPTLSSTIWWTVLCAGPIAWLFIYIAQGRYEQLPLTSVLAVLSAVLLTVRWCGYLAARRRYGKLLKDVSSRRAALWPMAFFCLAAVFAGMVGGSICYEKLFAPEGWLFYETPMACMQFQTYLLIILAAILFLNIRAITQKESSSGHTRSLIYTVVCTLLIPFVMYMTLSCTTFVTPNSIVICSPLDPYGKEYGYEEIEGVEARFGGKLFTFNEYEKRGTFSYRITLGEATVIFSAPTPNADIERYDDSYVELEELDARLMTLGIPKISSEDHAEYCDFDQRYVDRFLRIIHNK